jgi:starch phosphorylase
MAEEAGEENMFLFGLTAEEVTASRGWYSPYWHLEHDLGVRRALDLLASDHFNQDEPGIFRPIVDALLTNGDHYMHLADLQSYVQTQTRARETFATPDSWTRMAVINVACSGMFSSDRAISQYASEVWHAHPSPTT